MTTILIIEDDTKIANLLKLYCEQENYRVLHSESGKEGLELAKQIKPDLVLLDRMLPEMEGLDVLKEIRQSHSFPILILSAKSDEIERILGLEFGADDYITKPFSPKEVIARIKAVLRRSHMQEDQISEKIERGPLKLYPEKMLVQLNGKSIRLSGLEFKLLYLLASHPGRVFSREQIMESLYDSKAMVYDRTIDAHIKNLRKKLKDPAKKPRFLISVFGVGYKFKDL